MSLVIPSGENVLNTVTAFVTSLRYHRYNYEWTNFASRKKAKENTDVFLARLVIQLCVSVQTHANITKRVWEKEKKKESQRYSKMVWEKQWACESWSFNVTVHKVETNEPVVRTADNHGQITRFDDDTNDCSQGTMRHEKKRDERYFCEKEIPTDQTTEDGNWCLSV